MKYIFDRNHKNAEEDFVDAFEKVLNECEDIEMFLEQYQTSERRKGAVESVYGDFLDGGAEFKGDRIISGNGYVEVGKGSTAELFRIMYEEGKRKKSERHIRWSSPRRGYS